MESSCNTLIQTSAVLSFVALALQNAQSSSGTLNVLSGFDARNCYGSILIWNNDTVDGEATINVTNVPYDSFDVDVFHLDEDHMPGVSLLLTIPSPAIKLNVEFRC